MNIKLHTTDQIVWLSASKSYISYTTFTYTTRANFRQHNLYAKMYDFPTKSIPQTTIDTVWRVISSMYRKNGQIHRLNIDLILVSIDAFETFSTHSDWLYIPIISIPTSFSYLLVYSPLSRFIVLSLHMTWFHGSFK